jgi:transposase
MVANRCVAPCSKLRLTEWTPTTALPEILHFRPQQLHNTRLHRALDRLKDIEPKLTRFLVTHPARRTRPDSVVYLDLTSTWFEGHGGTLGLRGRCKDGAIHRHAIQIALAVDNRGIPLRWEVLSGKVAEVDALPSWLPALAEHSELSDLPIVFDRGLTSEENLSSLITAKRSFVTCARESLVEKWSLGVDLAALSQLPLDTVPTRDTLTKLGLKSTDDEDIYHVDQGARAVPSMETIDKLRVVPYFRPSLFVRNRESLDRVCLNVEGKVKAINEELKTAKRDRKEESTRKKITELLGNFGVAGEFDFAIHELSLAGARRPIRSFQVALTRRSTPSSRRLNCGWMMLLASPTDERPALDLIRQYHHKEVVEHSFGIIKSVVELRPIHHQTDQKIRAHVTICVLALLLARAIELRLREAGITDAIDRVFEALDPCRLQILSHKGQRPRYAITQLQPRQGQLLKALGLTHWSEPAALSGLQPRAAFLA